MMENYKNQSLLEKGFTKHDIFELPQNEIDNSFMPKHSMQVHLHLYTKPAISDMPSQVVFEIYPKIDQIQPPSNKQQDLVDLTNYLPSQKPPIVFSSTAFSTFKIHKGLFHVQVELLRNDCIGLFGYLSNQPDIPPVEIDTENQFVTVDFEGMTDYFNDPVNLQIRPMARNSRSLKLRERIDPNSEKYLNLFCPFWFAGNDSMVTARVVFDRVWDLPYYFGNRLI